jgi:hypothetical protein
VDLTELPTAEGYNICDEEPHNSDPGFTITQHLNGCIRLATNVSSPNQQKKNIRVCVPVGRHDSMCSLLRAALFFLAGRSIFRFQHSYLTFRFQKNSKGSKETFSGITDTFFTKTPRQPGYSLYPAWPWRFSSGAAV